MARPKVVILDDQLPTKINLHSSEFDDVEVVWTGQAVRDLVDVLPELNPQVLVLQLEHLGDNPIARAQELTQLADAELTIVTYAFARRDVIKALRNEDVRPMRAPLSLTALRAQMTSVIVRALMTEDAGTPQSESESQPESQKIRPPRYSPSHLARLESIPSSVQCECPNHISTLLSSLIAFEAYCKECESRNEEDAKIHRMLYERTAQARMLVEDGLERLLEHEDIRI